MKNLFLVVCISLFVVSCSTDNQEVIDTNANFTALVNTNTDNSSVGVYKGTFTTMDSQERGIVTVKINKAGNARAEVELVSGVTYKLNATQNLANNSEVQNLIFSNNDLNFSFSVEADGSNPTITDVSLNKTEAMIAILKETTRLPLLPITGTYSCTSCDGHPLLGQGLSQTFNAITVSGEGDNDQNIVTTIILDGTDFGSDMGNTQSNCANSGPDRTCDINGTSATIAGGRSIVWTGTHSFKRGGTVVDACSEVAGTWTFASFYGPMAGTFVGDATCGL